MPEDDARHAPRAVSRARRARSGGGTRSGRRSRCYCATARRRWWQWPTQAAYFYATPQVDPQKVAEQVTPPIRAALAELHAEFATLEWTREALAAAMKAAAAGTG